MSNLTKGILCSLLSAFALALMGLFFKLIGDNISSYEKLLSRGLGLFIVAWFLVIQAKKKNPEVKLLGHKQNAILLLMRSAAGGTAMLLYIYTLNYISLADADMLLKLNSVLLLILCAVFLKEKVTFTQGIIVVVSLLAALLIIKPSFNNPNFFAYAIGLVGTLLVSIAYMSIRYLTTKETGEHPATIMFHLACFIIITMIYPTIKNFNGFSGSGIFYLWLILSSICSAIGQFALTYSFKFAPAKEISVYSYTSLIWNFVLGFIFFMTIPDFLSIIGYVVIVASGIYLYFYNKARDKSKPNTKHGISPSVASIASTTPVIKPDSLNFNKENEDSRKPNS
ncbi:DMT family transporter [Psittacicella gerlachiana]|uniref:EamA domain-containing protein n=1 Tax=Psittacicella gerlachiana TaxID=2028574 RepID=A0A3A1Y5L3_9GAMM|nr:DMT family transporter [Psittacicella gerlachiana]RIY31344.1 hypothetical protein CKF59_07705 [Psittacicella gerlachiana]